MTTLWPYSYRIFLSYSRQNTDLVDKLALHLDSLGLVPMLDRHNPGGEDFRLQLKRQIDHAHVVVPLLTAEANSSEWVNQEIGYALGRNLPILPLCLNVTPQGIVADLQPERATRLEELFERPLRRRIEFLVEDSIDLASYTYADFVEERTEAIIAHTQELRRVEGARSLALRHVATFGSFSLPSNPWAPAWHDRNSLDTHGGYRRKQTGKERRLLEEYAAVHGCDLVIYPKLGKMLSAEVNSRIQLIQSFLQSMDEADVKVRILFDRQAREQNVLIVGDWFYAESVTPRLNEGYRHTAFTSHAPTVLNRWRDFDRRFPESEKWLNPQEAIDRLKNEFERSDR